MVNTPANFSRSEFHNRVFPVLAAMASYHEYLESPAQKALINALHVGLLSKDCYRICIVALTACALEMKKGMYHLIEKVKEEEKPHMKAKTWFQTPFLEVMCSNTCLESCPASYSTG